MRTGTLKAKNAVCVCVCVCRVHWTELAHDRYQWRAFVNAVMYTESPIKGGELD